jgi:hypothetical protein
MGGHCCRSRHGRIALEHLTQPAQAVIDAATAATAAMRAARYVVIDLRGNGGGNDLYGRLLANILYGDAYTAAVLGPMPGGDGECKSTWRASADNLAAMGALLAERTQAGETARLPQIAAVVDDLRGALAHGRALIGPLTCPQPVWPRVMPAALIRAPVLVLTDVACFSSCIGTVDWLRKLGAIQIGQSTNADTHNAEVRSIALPSGLSMFTTLQAIMPDAPYRLGPFLPAHVFPGDIADTAAVTRWITDRVLPAARVLPAR